MTDNNSASSFIQTVAQVATALIAALALLQTSSALQKTDESLRLLRKQVNDENDRHKQGRQWSIQPVLAFERGSSILHASKAVPLRLDQTGAIGKLLNVGSGPALDISVEWSIEGVKAIEGRRSVVKPDILLPQGQATLQSLPIMMGEVRFDSTKQVKGQVKLLCRDLDKRLSTFSQPFTLNVNWSEEEKAATIELKFDHVELVDWATADIY